MAIVQVISTAPSHQMSGHSCHEIAAGLRWLAMERRTSRPEYFGNGPRPTPADHGMGGTAETTHLGAKRFLSQSNHRRAQ
jgi:hypothetical protein